MIKNKSTFYRAVLLIILFLCLFFLWLQNTIFTGNASIEATFSNVSVTKSLAILFSSNLSSGISFGDVSVLPTLNVNASQNYRAPDNRTEYYINVSTDGNTAVDFCIKAGGDLTSLASDVLGVGNETYSNATLTNSSVPELSSEVALSLSYVKSGYNIAVGSVDYYRFWLDVPTAQPSGDYNNTISFKGIQTGVGC